QVAADALGLPIERVHFDLGDTEMPETPTSGGSLTAASVGSAVRMACLAARQKLAKLAGVAPEEGKLEGQLADILARNKLESLDARYRTQDSEERKKYSTRSFGAQLVEVRVDPDLGVVRVARVVSAFAGGRILNEKTARSQYIGGIVMGLGMGLLESTIYDPRLGRNTNADLPHDPGPGQAARPP